MRISDWSSDVCSSDLAYVNPKSGTPIGSIAAAGVIMLAFSGFVPLGRLAELANIGTLGAFVVVCAGVIVMRRTHPDLPRPFRTPASPDRNSVVLGKSVSVRVVLGGRRISKKKNHNNSK